MMEAEEILVILVVGGLMAVKAILVIMDQWVPKDRRDVLVSQAAQELLVILAA
jgi:hypothetical protein